VEACRGLRLLKLAEINPSQEEMARHLCRGRVFVSACWHEGFNLCGLEAFACGVPVAMTDDGGSRDYARNGENALVVPVGDAPALRAAIDRLLWDQELRLRFIEAGMDCALKSSWSAVTANFEAFLQNCLDQVEPSAKIVPSEV
jgi:glycosyltransferase involved in cell wall biosynthesis